MTKFTRTTHTPDTFGMSSTVARRTRQRATGQLSAEQGRHRGGPCPAVALATITGWTYARAERYLERHGFRGTGMIRDQFLAAAREVLGEPVQCVRSPRGSVAESVRFFSRGYEGFVSCRGHVMPVRGGRVLNASPKHLAMRAECVTVWRVEEESR